MITYEQFTEGAMRYVDAEMAPRMSAWKRAAFSVYCAMVAKNIPATLAEYENNMAVTLTGVIKDGQIDIAKLWSELQPALPERVELHIPLIECTYSLQRADFERMYNYIRGAM